MIKFVAVVRRKDGLSFDDFTRLWCDEHAALVLAMPGVRGYTQNLASDGSSRQWPMDGIAEVWFDDRAAVRQAFASPAGKAANDHQDLFAGDVRWFLAEERRHDPDPMTREHHG